MDFAVIRLYGKQHLVSEGENISVQAKLEPGKDNLTIDQILLLGRDDKLEFGTPFVSGVKLTGTVLSTGRGDKVRVAKFKAKSRYRKVMGFRPDETIIKVTGIQKNKATSSPSDKKVIKEKTKK